MDCFGNQNYVGMDLADVNPPQHQCNLIYQEKFSLYGEKWNRKRKQQEAWKRHLQRIEFLSKPKIKVSRLKTVRDSKGAFTSKLLQRIKILSQPKCVTPKFVKIPEERFELPGKIKDWESHRRWLKLRAQPKRLRKPTLPPIKESDEEYIELKD